MFECNLHTLSKVEDFSCTFNSSARSPVTSVTNSCKYFFLIIALGLSCAFIVINFILSPKNPDPEKLSAYECGFEPFEDARMQFDIRYYLVAILFILFDLEIAFLFPWAVAFKDLDFFGLISMMIFLGILVVGFVYEWAKGALDWE